MRFSNSNSTESADAPTRIGDLPRQNQGQTDVFGEVEELSRLAVEEGALHVKGLAEAAPRDDVEGAAREEGLHVHAARRGHLLAHALHQSCMGDGCTGGTHAKA